MPVGIDGSSPSDVCRQKDQMRRATVLGVNLQNEGFSGIWVSRPPSNNSPLALVLFKDERSCLGDMGCLRRRRQWRRGVYAYQDCANCNTRTDNSHEMAPHNGCAEKLNAGDAPVQVGEKSRLHSFGPGAPWCPDPRPETRVPGNSQ